MDAFLNFGPWGGPYQTVKAEGVAEAPMPHHKAGLSYTRSGYGEKIPTVYMVKYDGVWRRVYCAVFSNSGTTYVKVRGEDVVVRLDD